jgi:DNA-binding response OmpR family regulator
MGTKRNPAILVVDDDEAIRNTLKEILDGFENFKVFLAKNGKTAMEKLSAIAKQHHPILLLLDVRAPGHDVLETYQELKEKGFLSKASVIFITTSKQSVAVDIPIIRKPFSIEDLVEKIRGAVK